MREQTIACIYQLSICLYEMIWDLGFFTLFYLQLLGDVKQCYTLKLKILSDAGKAKFHRKCGMSLDALKKVLIPKYSLRESFSKSIWEFCRRKVSINPYFSFNWLTQWFSFQFRFWKKIKERHRRIFLLFKLPFLHRFLFSPTQTEVTRNIVD